jgi:hypothetical protein
MSKQLWYYAEGQRVIGPFEFDQLVQLVRSGRIVATTMVRSTEHNDWLPALQVRGLIVEVRANPPWGGTDTGSSLPPPPPPPSPEGSRALAPRSRRDEDRDEPPPVRSRSDRDRDRDRDERRPAPRSRQQPDRYDDRRNSGRGNQQLESRSRIPESGYVARNLVPGERILHSAHLHPIVFVRPIFGALAGVIALIIRGEVLTQPHQADARLWALIPCLLVIVASVFYFFNVLIDYLNSEFVVTNRQIILKTGFIQRQTLELYHNRIHSFRVNQSVFGRMFNYGDFLIGSASDTQVFRTIANPMEFRRQVNSQQDI